MGVQADGGTGLQRGAHDLAQPLAKIAEAFDIAPVEPYEKVKALQEAFDPSVLQFSDEYYDTLGIERE